MYVKRERKGGRTRFSDSLRRVKESTECGNYAKMWKVTESGSGR